MYVTQASAVLCSLLLVSCDWAQSTGQYMVCRNVEDVFIGQGSNRSPQPLPTRQGPPGKKGIPGENGRRGPQGLKGERGADGAINQAAMDAFMEKILEKVNRTIAEKIQAVRKAAGICHVAYENKCYSFILKSGNTLTLAKARLGCDNLGGNLANIYDNDHYNAISSYVKRDLLESTTVKYFWLGMKYDPKTKSVTLRNGEEGPDLKWNPGVGLTSSTYMFMGVGRSESNTGVYNYPLPNPRDAALCEF